MSFSQTTEEQTILGWFAGRVGRFLDIGAHDGVKHSNTRELARRGWSGVCVEPNPNSFVHLMENYEGNHRVRLLNAAVALASGLVRFQACDIGVSSMHEDHCRTWLPTVQKATERDYQPVHVCVVTPGEVLDAFPGPYHFVSVDVEGGNWRLLCSMDLDAFGVELLCIEYTGDLCKIERYCTRLGYQRVGLTAENLIVGRR